jgi:hypothetical protein
LAFLLASPATLWLVFKVLVVEKSLFARGEDEIRTAVDALKGSILKFWHRLAPAGPCPGFMAFEQGAVDGPAPFRSIGCLEVLRLFRFPAALLPVPFTCQRLLHPLLLTGLQIKGVTFYFFDDVLLLYLPLKPAKGVLNGFALLQFYFCQTETTPPAIR